jgi:hypothetical protein
MNTDKTTILKAFNIHLFEMLDDISSIYPNNIEVNTGKTSLENIKKMNPTTIIKVWYNYVYLRYQSQIDAGNLSFFFDKDYSEDLTYISNNDAVLKLIDNVRSPLKSMSPENKQHTLSYLQNLNKLAKMYQDL